MEGFAHQGEPACLHKCGQNAPFPLIIDKYQLGSILGGEHAMKCKRTANHTVDAARCANIKIGGSVGGNLTEDLDAMALAFKEAMPLHGIDRMAPSHQEAEGSDRSGDGFFHFL